MNAGPVLVTGALGNAGAATAAALLAAGLKVRAADLDTEACARKFPAADAVRLDFLDSATFRPALRGCQGLFLLRPPPIARVKHTVNRLIDVAVEAGVHHVVFSSVQGADTNRIVPHHRIEEHLKASGLPWTMLRPGFFAQNLTGAYRLDIRDDHRLYVPAGRGRVAFIDVTDLGEVAARVFADPAPHQARGYTLTGPHAITFDQVAEMLTAALGHPVRYQPATTVGYIRHLRRRRLPMPQIAVQTVLHLGLRRGDAEMVDPNVERLLGRPATPLKTFIQRNLSCWS
ncbi:MAG: NmrA family NAD(P)-binding protein [Actinobacteria bacterium]|nr:NmrA family NAD(P)-binding protein [Actinomycetota bacterium]